MGIATTMGLTMLFAAGCEAPKQFAQAQTNTSPATTTPKSGSPTTSDKAKGNWSVTNGRSTDKWGKLSDDGLWASRGTVKCSLADCRSAPAAPRATQRSESRPGDAAARVDCWMVKC